MRFPQRPLVRPIFARVSVIVFALLTPVVVHAIWDYVEMRRLRTRIEAISARGEPTTTTVVRPLLGPAAEAGRYYAAASALVSGYTAEIPAPVWYQLLHADRGSWSPDLLDRARGIVTRHAEALTLLDRAAALPFEGFQGGTTSTYLVGNLYGAARLCQLRAAIRTLEGQPDAAAESVYTGIRLTRVIDQLIVLPELAIVLQRAHPSPAAMARLRDALAEIDRDDQLKVQFTRMRAMVIDQSYNVRLSDAGLSPWDGHRLNRRLDTFAALIAAARKPAAERHATVMAVGEWPFRGLPADLSRKQLEMQVSFSERQAAAIGCARRLVAGEVVDCPF